MEHKGFTDMWYLDFCCKAFFLFDFYSGKASIFHCCCFFVSKFSAGIFSANLWWRKTHRKNPRTSKLDYCSLFYILKCYFEDPNPFYTGWGPIHGRFLGFFWGHGRLGSYQDVIQAFLKLYPVAEQTWHELFVILFYWSCWKDWREQLGSVRNNTSYWRIKRIQSISVDLRFPVYVGYIISILMHYPFKGHSLM